MKAGQNDLVIKYFPKEEVRRRPASILKLFQKTSSNSTSESVRGTIGAGLLSYDSQTPEGAQWGCLSCPKLHPLG